MPEGLKKSILEMKKKEREWWTGSKRLEIYNLVIRGKSVKEICELTNSRVGAVQRIISNPIFLKKLEPFLSGMYFSFQVNKILALDEIFKYYWDIVMGRKKDDELSKDQASKYLIKLLSLNIQDPKIINPKQYNLIMNVFKEKAPKKYKEIAEEFGFEDLEVPEDKGPQIPPELDKYEGSTNT